MVDGSAGTVLLGLDGLVLLAVSERDGELEQAVETTAAVVRCASWGGGPPACSASGVGAGPARRGSPGDRGVGQAGVALPRADVCEADVDRDAPGGAVTLVVDRTRPGRGVPARRAGRALGDPGRDRVRGVVGDGDDTCVGAVHQQAVEQLTTCATPATCSPTCTPPPAARTAGSPSRSTPAWPTRPRRRPPRPSSCGRPSTGPTR